MKYVFMINPVAGRADASGALIPKIRAAAQTLGLPCNIVVTTHPGHAGELAASYAEAGQEAWLFACGGDGTLNELVQQAVGHPCLSVGCVPCGSGNDFIRNFGTHSDFWDIEAQLGGTTMAVDAIQTGYGYSAAICAAGLDAKVAYNIPRFRRLPFCGGSMAYNLAIANVFFGKLGTPLEIEVDVKQFSGEYMMAAICNGRQYGGGYTAAPFAMMDDGLLDIVLVKPMPRHKIPAMLALYKTGAHLSAQGTVVPQFAPYMQSLQAQSIRLRVVGGPPIIVTLDGECAPRMELAARVVPKCLSVILPQNVLDKPLAVRLPANSPL
ncbi:MAG: diacylglycerol kinase family protein [Gemmiger sp.]|nr:diacylglycerol kinase family protein [Gemmiger sp.]